MLSQLLIQPASVMARHVQIFLHEPAVTDEDNGQAVLLGFYRQLRGGRGLTGGIGENGQLSVGFQNGIFNGGQVGAAFHAKLLKQLVHGVAVALHFTLVQFSVTDHNAGLAAHEDAKAGIFHGQHRKDHGHGQQGEDGDDAREQGNAEILHGYGGQIGYE